MTFTETKKEGFESVFKHVGGSGRFQYYACAVSSLATFVMTWNHLGYIFLGAVPNHWCHIQELENSSWTMEQIRNISIPVMESQSPDGDTAKETKFEQCLQYDLDYGFLLEQSERDFDRAYTLAHSHHRALNEDQISDGSLVTSGASSKNHSIKKCDAWVYDKSLYQSTVVTEFDLVCGRRYLTATIQSTYMIGALMGNLIFGPLNDKILGRRYTVLTSLAVVIIGGFFTSISYSYIMFIASRFLIAFGLAGHTQTVKIWLVEHCDTNSRATFYCMAGISFGVAYTIMPVYAYYIRTWTFLQMAFTLSTLSLLSFIWIFPESARWLAHKGREEEAIKALQRIARFNKVPVPECHILLKYVRLCQLERDTVNSSDTTDEKESICLQPSDETGSGMKNDDKGKKSDSGLSAIFKSFGSLVATPELRRITFVMSILIMTDAFVYYGFVFTATSITTNGFLLVSLGGSVEIISAIIPMPFVGWLGRRPTLIACYVITGCAALLIALTPANYLVARMILYMTGKLFITSVYIVAYLIISEGYPTAIRSTGRGVASIMGRFGGMVAPYVADMLTTVYPDLPSIIFGVASIVVTPIVMLLPEFKGVEMKDQVNKNKATKDNPKDGATLLNAA